MKKETVIEIWDDMGSLFIFSFLLVKHWDFFSSQMLQIVYIVGLLVFGLIGLFLKFRYGVKWLSYLFFISVFNLLFGVLFIYLYFIG